jgi:WD repeat-containing protein 61
MAVECWTAAFSPDGRYIATGAHAGNVNTWVTETGEKDRVLETKGKFIMSVAYVLSFNAESEWTIIGMWI